MNTKSSSARGIKIARPLRIPLNSLGSAASYTWTSRNRQPRRVLWEEPFKDHSVVVCLFCSWCVVWVNILGIQHHLISHMICYMCFQSINPTISNTITELLFLPIQNILG